MSSDIAGTSLYSRVIDWSNLLVAYRKAAKGKRGKGSAAAFEHQVADRLLELQSELRDFSYRPGGYVHFMIHDPKQRLISAAPFRDRVVHHALCNVIEPLFEEQFISDSYANRRFKGTHKAIDRLQAFSRKYRYVLRIDLVKHFPSIDHAILRDILAETIEEDELRWLIERIIRSGEGVLADEYEMVYFPGDDLFAVTRPRGLPIGNLTSQFWSNVYMTPLDRFLTFSRHQPPKRGMVGDSYAERRRSSLVGVTFRASDSVVIKDRNKNELEDRAASRLSTLNASIQRPDGIFDMDKQGRLAITETKVEDG